MTKKVLMQAANIKVHHDAINLHLECNVITFACPHRRISNNLY